MTLGQPFEVWKTRMGRHRGESTAESFQYIFRTGGVRAFYRGLGPKIVESLTKGGILLVAKDAIQDNLQKCGASPTMAGFVGGAGGGVAGTIRKTWAERGVRGFYPGGSAIAARQASNWASRVGFTEVIRQRIATLVYGDPRARLSMREEALAGIFGGVLSCWNHPFEVARIEMQARSIAGEAPLSMWRVLTTVHAEHGLRGLFQGILPRMGLNINLTLFMVSGSNIMRCLRERQGDRSSALLTRDGARLVEPRAVLT